MALADYQKITRVTSGKPFGNGSDGAYSSATIPTMKVKACTGTATATKFAADTDATPFEVDDIILLHQSRGTGVGQWEIVKVSSVGSDEYNTSTALNYSYTTKAQATVIKQYTDVTVETGTWALPAWNGTTGGTLVFACNGTLTVTGTIHGHGGNGAAGSGGRAGGTGGGFRGGASFGGVGDDGPGYQGEGTPGGGAKAYTANGNGGGGQGGGSNDGASGGGNGAVGTAGGGSSIGGTVGGVAALTTMVFGGGGGGTGKQTTYNIGSGGSGGGVIAIFAKDIATITGSILMTGGNGASGENNYGGGGGAGGSVLIQCGTAALGATKIVSSGGSAGTGGGAGAVGRIAVHRSGTVTGTTSPTFSDTEDSSLVETTASSGATGFFHFM